MNISKEYAAADLVCYNGKNGDKVAVSTSEYNDMVYFRKVAKRQGQRVAFANVQTMRGFAKRGLIEWEQSWRSGTATILDVDTLKLIAEGKSK